MPQGQEWREGNLDQEGASWSDLPEGQRAQLHPAAWPALRPGARPDAPGADRIGIPTSSSPSPERRAGRPDLSQAKTTVGQGEPTFEPSTAAQVLALDGTWAKLWFPESDETLWVDLTQIDYEPAVARRSPPSHIA
jgi:hypothetical protein